MTLKSVAIQAKIDALTIKLGEAKAIEANTITTDKLAAGTKVDFKFGKGEGARVLKGTVLGLVVPAEGAKGGTLVRILTGEGVDTRVVSVFVSAITAVESTEAAAE